MRPTIAIVISKTQVDRLGNRLKKGSVDEADLRLLDQYRRSFAPAYESVIDIVSNQIKLRPTGRIAKSTQSVIDKLRRESIRLSQMQDIVGCRLIVEDIREQAEVVQILTNTFARSNVVDRRSNPSHGYRAVHLIVVTHDKVVEIQVRTTLQHLWAELSEKWSDVEGIAVKYGGGPEPIRFRLATMSSLIGLVETTEKQLYELLLRSPSENRWSDALKITIQDVRAVLKSQQQLLATSMNDMIAQRKK